MKYKTGLTAGTFDILTSKHVDLLWRMKSMCGRLIVGVNTEAKLARRKPNVWTPLDQRMALVESLAPVDEVFACDLSDMRLIESGEQIHDHAVLSARFDYDAFLIGSDYRDAPRYVHDRALALACGKGYEFVDCPYDGKGVSSSSVKAKLDEAEYKKLCAALAETGVYVVRG